MSQSDPFLARMRTALDGERRRGERAALRRYWSPATRSQAYPVLGQLGALDDNRKTILAALYAEHPEHRAGQTVGKAALQLGKREGGDHPYDRHFRRLLACQELGTIAEPGDLAEQLHRLVKRLSRGTKEHPVVGLDYESLLINLRSWTKTSQPGLRENVKLRWASDFWGAPVPADL